MTRAGEVVYGDAEPATGQEAASRLDRLLEGIAEDVDAHIAAVYLQVPDRQLLQLTTVVGAPERLATAWSRVALAAPAPVPEAVRTRGPVWLPDRQQLADRFPRAALVFPYCVAMYVVPLTAGTSCWGALLLMWPGRRPEGLTSAERARCGEAATRMADVLRDEAALGRPLRPRSEPLVLETRAAPDSEPAAALLDRLADGFVALDPRGRITYLNEAATLLLGRARRELLDAEPWDVLPWLNHPVYENAYVAALVNRRRTGFAARRPDGAWLSFLLYPDATGISVRVTPRDAPAGAPASAPDVPPAAPARAGTLFHLLQLAAALSEAAGVDEVAGSLTEQMRPGLGADGLALMVADEGRLRVVGSRGFPPGTPSHFSGLPTATPTEGTRTMETGVPRFHPTNAELVRTFPQHRPYQAMGAFAFLPLTVSGRTFGCLVLGYDNPRSFNPDERAELTSLAGMIAQTLERARLYDATAQVARGLQDGLLPHHLPHVPGLEVAARYRPATHALEVGGDLYDLIDFGPQAAAVIGDVQGHSVRAAALMGQIRTAVHSHARTGAPPEEILARTNRMLLELHHDLFCSCLYAHLDVPRSRVLLASAGHLPPVLRHQAHHAEILDLPPGLLLGVEEEAHFQTVEVPLRPGAVLALYTDGLVERPGIDIGASIGRLAGRLADADDQPLDSLADTIIEDAERTAAHHANDDMALLLVKCRTDGDGGRAPASGPTTD